MNMKNSFNDFSPESRVWIFQCEKPLTNPQIEHASAQLDAFMQQWASHGNALQAAYKWYFGQMAVVVVNESVNAASGCSIDKLTHFFEQIGTEGGANFMNRDIAVLHNQNKSIELYSLHAFKESVASGRILPHTLMLNNAVTQLHEWQNSWIKPVKETWAAKWLPKTYEVNS